MFKIVFPQLHFSIEKWKYNKDFELYVSNLGNIKSKTKKDIQLLINKSGYFTLPERYGYKAVHRLVLMTWKPKRDIKNLTVDHINRNKRDNSLKNLEWVTQEENLKRSTNDYCPSVKPIYIMYKTSTNYFFYSIDDAVAYVVKIQNLKDYHKDRIEKRIRSAISNKQPYCNIMWEAIEE